MKRSLICAVLLLCARAAAADDVAVARDLFTQGMKLLESGKPDEAIASFDSAYRAKPAPSFYFYLGEAHREAGHASRAVEYYQLYLDKMPEGPKKAEAQARLVELRGAAKEKAAPPARRRMKLAALALNERKAEPGKPAPAGVAPSQEPAAPAAAADAKTAPAKPSAVVPNQRTAGSPAAPKPAAAPEPAARPPAAAPKLAAVTPASARTALPAAAVQSTPKAGDTRPADTRLALATPAAPRPAAPAAALQPASRARAAWTRPTSIVLGGAGLASLAAGAIFGLQAKTASEDVTRAAAAHQPFDPDRESAGKRAQTLSLVFAGIGGAAAVAGMVLFALSP